jgi:hypothetical protein
MSGDRRKLIGRAESGGYFALPRVVMDSPNYIALTAHAVKLLNDLGNQLRKTNNGDLSAAWRIMRPRGWRSRDTLFRALRELLYFGMIQLTRQGGLNSCNLYALTWRPIDECGHKLDVSKTPVASNLWKTPHPPMPKPYPKKRTDQHGDRVEPARQACRADTEGVSGPTSPTRHTC